MTSGHRPLDPSQLHHAHGQIDSGSQFFDDSSDMNPQPSTHAPFMDNARFDDFPFSFPTLSNQTPLALPDPPNAAQTSDSFSQQQPIAAMNPSQSAGGIAGPSLPYGNAPSDHRSKDSDGPDDGQEKNSPILEDSIPDEFGISSHGRADGTDLGGKAKEDRGDAGAPPWSELKTKAGKERKRLPLACIACRRKKIRCSGEKPACKHCLRSRIPCVYKVTTRKAAPRTDYMAMLDKRLKRMEERIIKVVPRPDPDSSSPVIRAVVKPALPGAPTNKANGRKRGADEAFGPGLEAWAKAPMKLKINGIDEAGAAQVQEIEESKLFDEGSKALPPKEMQEHLAEVFFDFVYGQAYHLLHKPSYMAKLRSNTLPPVLVLSVCAVAARFTTNPKIGESPLPFLRGEEWASHARDICIRRYDRPNLTILTCLLILGLHEFGTCQGDRSWALGGQAIRMAFALQLHKDLDYDPMERHGKRTKLSFIDREIRRRIMWACFLMDRFNSSGKDRPIFIREETIQIPLPVNEHYFKYDIPAPTETLDGRVLHHVAPEDGQHTNTRTNMGLSAYTIRAIAIWGRIVTYVNHGGKDTDPFPMWNKESLFAKLRNDVASLESSLPPSLEHSSDNMDVHKTANTANQLLFLHLCIQQIVLFLSQAASIAHGLTPHGPPPQGFVTESRQKTINAANKISEILKEAEEFHFFVSAPFAGYCAFSSTTIHILGIVSQNPVIKPMAEANLVTNVKFLQKMKKYWGMFDWMIEHMRALYRNALDAARSGAALSDQSASSSLLQYGDWFARYPHGLSGAEFKDPATQKHKEKGADGVMEAKPELQSAEEYFSNMSPAQASEHKDGPRQGTQRRKTGSKKHDGNNTQASQQKLDSVSNAESGGRANARQQRTYSDALGGHSTAPTGFSPALARPGPMPYHHPMSPINQAAMAAFTPSEALPFIPSDLLALDFTSTNGPSFLSFERPLPMGGYPMEPDSNLPNGPNLFEDMDWSNLAAGGPINRDVQNRRPSMKDATASQVSQNHTAMAAASNGQDSSAWFMPFKMEPPPEMAQDLSLGIGNVDPFAGLFTGGGSGAGAGAGVGVGSGAGAGGNLTTPNPMEGLQNGS